jgi:hypothetical protein
MKKIMAANFLFIRLSADKFILDTSRFIKAGDHLCKKCNYKTTQKAAEIESWRSEYEINSLSNIEIKHSEFGMGVFATEEIEPMTLGFLYKGEYITDLEVELRCK